MGKREISPYKPRRGSALPAVEMTGGACERGSFECWKVECWNVQGTSWNVASRNPKWEKRDFSLRGPTHSQERMRKKSRPAPFEMTGGRDGVRGTQTEVCATKFEDFGALPGLKPRSFLIGTVGAEAPTPAKRTERTIRAS
jgi:hypothetical protein